MDRLLSLVTVFFFDRQSRKRLKARETYLEALVGLLATGDVFSSAGDDDDGDFVVVAPEELLCSANNVSDYDRGAQRENDVLVVRMQNQSLVHLACDRE